MYSCGGPYRDIYNHVLVCMAMYPFPISIPIFRYFKPLYDKYTKYLPVVWKMSAFSILKDVGNNIEGVVVDS